MEKNLEKIGEEKIKKDLEKISQKQKKEELLSTTEAGLLRRFGSKEKPEREKREAELEKLKTKAHNLGSKLVHPSTNLERERLENELRRTEEEIYKLEGGVEAEKKEEKKEIPARNLDEIRSKLAEMESRKLKPEEKQELEKLREEYKKARLEYLLKKELSVPEIHKAILEEQEKFIKEREKYLPKWKRNLNKVLGNKVMQAYIKIPRKYRWIGFAALGSASLMAGGAGLTMAGTYFGYRLSRYAAGALTSAGAMKGVEVFEKRYGIKMNKKLEEKVDEIIKKENSANNIEKLLDETDPLLEKILKGRKRFNLAKVGAGVAGFLAGYEATDAFGHSILEGLGVAKAEAAQKAAEVTHKVSEAKISYLETAKSGDSVWKLAERAAAQKFGAQWQHLDIAQRDYILDALKDKIAAAPEKFGLHTHNIDLIHPGDKVDFSPLLNNKEFVNSVVDKAQHLSFDDKVHIVSKIDWEKTVPFGKGKTAVVSHFEKIKGDFGLNFVDTNHDKIPDFAAIADSKGKVIDLIAFKGNPQNLSDIAHFSHLAHQEAEKFINSYSPEDLVFFTHHPDVLHKPELLKELKGLADFSHTNLENAWSAHLLTGSHLELLKNPDGSWNSDQLAVLSHLSGPPEKIQDALSFSHRLSGGIDLNHKIAWAELRLNPANHSALKAIRPDLNVDKLKDTTCHWQGNTWIGRIHRRMWFDKEVKLKPGLSPKRVST